jgi:hypothetical protein
VIARDQAPEAFTAWDELIDAVASTTPTDLTELARAIARASLDPAVPAVPRSDTVVFAEQMVVDVASMTTDVRAAGLAELGAGAPAFVLALWTEDMTIRADAAWREMFGEQSRPIPISAETVPWVAHERFLVEVANCELSIRLPPNWSGSAAREPTTADSASPAGTSVPSIWPVGVICSMTRIRTPSPTPRPWPSRSWMPSCGSRSGGHPGSVSRP